MQTRLRVLIADSDDEARARVRRALDGAADFDVCTEAADAATAVEAAVREAPDVCLVDIRMNGSGLAAIWEIAARCPGTKIVVLTASAEHADLFAALRAGVGGYLLKDMDFSRIPASLRDAAAGRAAMPRELVSRLIEEFRDNRPRWRGTTDERLTSREWQVVELLRRGLTTRQIALRLLLSPVTVRTHIAGAVRKLGVADRAELARQA